MKFKKYIVFVVVIALLYRLIYPIISNAINNEDTTLTISYRTHVQDIGWQAYKTNGELSGTTGQAKRLEAIDIKLADNNSNINIKYQVHVQDIGWQAWKANGELSGTTGQAKRLEAIRINTDDTSSYTIMYRVHVQDIGWQAWKTNGELAGTTGQSKRLEAIEIKVIKIKNEEENNTIVEPNIVDTDMHIKYQTHVQNVGWQTWKQDGDMAGTSGQNLRIEAIKIQLINVPQGAHVKYRAHVQNIGWQAWKQDGDIAGTTGQNLRIEAIQIKIEGIDGYTIEYQAHVQDVGWQQWAGTEMISGTVSQNLRVEALKLKVVKTEDSVVPNVKYSSHVSNIGWEKYVKNGEVAGSTNGNNLEALKIALEKATNGAQIKYQSYVQNTGWTDEVANEGQSGTTGQSKAIEYIKIYLQNMPGYCIEYRVYIHGIGWQDWVRDGSIAGINEPIGAIQIKLNIDAYPQSSASSFNINTSKYPGYKELIDRLQNIHPTWNFRILYTGLNFNDAVYGEYSNHSANLVPTSSGNEWICSVCGTKLYDTGWYGASDKAIAYYMDPRNFLNENDVFQFLDANKYESTSVSIEGIQTNVNGTFLQNYASDINTACKNKGVNPYYVISRLIQENGKNGSTTSRGMDGGDGKIYYNPFNIGASGNSTSQVIANALAKAKANGWDTMEKALEGGIVFLKANWLDNYQNTLYQNRFDIDSTNGTSLYSHQYMQNLAGAYSEGNLLRGYYANAGKLDSNLTFIVPVYEGMSTIASIRPSEGTSSEEYPMNVVVNTSGSTLALRSGANTSSTVIARYNKGTVLLSVQRGINSTWQHVVTKDGKFGYMSGEYLKQVNDEYLCNYKAYIKTQSSGGLSVRTGPSTTEGFSKVDYLPDYTEITVIDDATYKGYEGPDWVQWSRVILADGRQAFVPSSYVKRK